MVRGIVAFYIDLFRVLSLERNLLYNLFNNSPYLRNESSWIVITVL